MSEKITTLNTAYSCDSTVFDYLRNKNIPQLSYGMYFSL